MYLKVAISALGLVGVFLVWQGWPITVIPSIGVAIFCFVSRSIASFFDPASVFRTYGWLVGGISRLRILDLDQRRQS
jgi:hypothetical protein